MEENDGGREGAGEGATENTSPNRLIICLMILSVSPTIKKTIYRPTFHFVSHKVVKNFKRKKISGMEIRFGLPTIDLSHMILLLPSFPPL